MPFTVEHGDMFSRPSDAYAHGVNIRGVMGAGVAVAVKKKWPEMYAAYREECLSGALQAGSAFAYRTADGWVYNCASQDDPGRNARTAWLVRSLVAAYHHMNGVGVKTVSLPLIGGGIGGINPSEARRAVEMVARGLPDNDNIATTLWIYP